MKFKKFVVCMSLCAALFAAPAMALQPEDALTAQPAESIYMAGRVDNLGDLLRWALSEKNLNLAAPMMGDKDGSITGLIQAALSTMPDQSVALVAGMTAEGMPIAQLAIAVPNTLEDELAAVAGGKAQVGDVLALLLGKDNPVADMFKDMLDVKAGDGMIVINDMAYATAKDNLLLVAMMPDDLKNALAAIDGKNRFEFKRGLDGKDKMAIHVDFKMARELSLASVDDKDDVEALEEAYKELENFFVAPLELEMAFKALANKFSVAGAFNFTECVKPEYINLKDMSDPMKGAGLRLIGEGSPLLAFATFTKINLDEIAKMSGDAKEIVDLILETLEEVGIAKDVAVAFMNGELSITAGGKLDVLGMGKLPGIAVTQNGQGGAAAIFDVIANTAEGMLAAAKVNGFDKAIKANPEALPVNAIIGLKDNALTVCAMDDDSLAAKPAPAGGMEELLAKESYMTLGIDFEGLRAFLVNPANNVAAMADALIDEGMGAMLMAILDVDLSVPTMNMWVPTFGTFNIDFGLADVAPERGVWAKIMELAM